MDNDTIEIRTGTVKIVAACTLIILAGGSLTAAVALLPGGASAQAESFSVDDVTAETDAVEEIELVGSGEVTYSNLAGEFQGAEFRVHVENPDGSRSTEVFSCTNITQQHGGCEYHEAEQTVYWGNSAPNVIFLFQMTEWSADDFEPPAGGEVSQEIAVRVEMEIQYDGGSVTADAQDSATITVESEP